MENFSDKNAKLSIIYIISFPKSKKKMCNNKDIFFLETLKRNTKE
jgi:hypothetical protein